ncbi:hypothetical protein H5410_010638 [Solanum commersonii]|uniref:Uncharacterized protein n=1 Tax=Solanum commersonii TaxID=4109 RepID=A0A9J6AM46_SOLCO|nr:hypothetical protein H5410_010638 [Solanum commersonii]
MSGTMKKVTQIGLGRRKKRSWVATRSNADSREHENAKDHICQQTPGASCANAQLIVWTTSCYIAKVETQLWQHSCGGSVKLVQNTVDDAKHPAGMFSISTNVKKIGKLANNKPDTAVSAV